jgi:cell division protein FtsW
MDASIYRLRQRDLLTLCVIALLLLGAIMVQSASMSASGSASAIASAPAKWGWSAPGTKHALFAALGLGAFLLIGHVDYAALGRYPSRIWKTPVLWLLAGSAGLCLLVLVPHVGLEVNGARRWLPLGPIQLQPSELAKWAVVLFLSWWLTNRPLDLSRFATGFLPTVIPIVALCLLVVIQDFGTAALIMLCALGMLLAGRIKTWHLLVVIPPVLMAGMWFIMHKEYRWRRMTAFVDPWAAPQGEGYHMIQSLLSFATGGVPGRGLGNGIQKLGYLPEDTTDFIFSVICEELGLFGALLTVALYLGVLYIAWQAVKQKRDSFGRMLAFGIGSMIGLQAAINIAVATVSVPTKGLSLPLISAGGSGLIITCCALGLLHSVTRYDHVEEEVPARIPSQPRQEPWEPWEEMKVSTSALGASAIWTMLNVPPAAKT